MYAKILISAIKFKPDIFLSQGGIYTAPIAFFLNKPSIVTEDTENAKWSHKIARLFNSIFLTPDCFSMTVSNSQFFFNGLMELCYF